MAAPGLVWSQLFVGPGRGWTSNARLPPLPPTLPPPPMAHQLVNVRPAPRDEDAPASLTLERALQILLVAAPHLPKERQISLLAMALGTASSLPPHKAITTPTAPLRLPFAPEVLRGVIQAKTYVRCSSTFAST